MRGAAGLVLWVAACADPPRGPAPIGLPDDDEDGFLVGDDCDDGDGAVFPGAPEVVCDGVDQDCDGEDESDPDGDGSGCGADCAEGDPTVHPGAADALCDGIDQDCDGSDVTDPDADGSGCADDCAPYDPDVHPGASEIAYDGIDQDCDGADWNDVDGDGWVWEGAGGDDCDDTDPALHPGAIEIALDGIDQDCDGSDATPGSPCATTGPPLGALDLGSLEGLAEYPSAPEPWSVGFAVAGNFDANGDGREDVAVGAPGLDAWDGYGSMTQRGAVFLRYDPACGSSDLSAPDAVLLGTYEGQPFGNVLVPLGDVDGDGWDDLAVGTGTMILPEKYGWLDDVWLVYGPFVGTTEVSEANALRVDPTTSFRITTRTVMRPAGTLLGTSASLLVGAGAVGGTPDLDYGVYVIDPTDRRGYMDVESEAAVRMEPIEEVGTGGNDATIGDVNGDGTDDLHYRGWVFLGPLARGTFSIDDADAEAEAPEGYEAYIGLPVGGILDDATGDGIADLWLAYDVVHPGTGGKGWLYPGGTPVSFDVAASAASITDPVDSSVQEIVSEAPDLDGNGTGDLVFNRERGLALFYTPLSGAHGLEDADAALVLEEDGPYTGVRSVVLGGDLDDDGTEDLLLALGQWWTWWGPGAAGVLLGGYAE